ncbi:hypothetical protein ACQY0O_003968 [Thecaphora frezii]
MATSAPLAAPVSFLGHSSAAAAASSPSSVRSGGSLPLRWKRQSPAHLGQSGLAATTNLDHRRRSRQHDDEDDDNDDDDVGDESDARLCSLWGLPTDTASHSKAFGSGSGSATSSRISSRTGAQATSMLTWDDADLDNLEYSDAALTGYHADAQDSSANVMRESSATRIHRTIASAPFSPTSGRVTSPSPALPAGDRSVPPARRRLGPIRGRMLAVGLSDGNVLLYQSRQSSAKTPNAVGNLPTLRTDRGCDDSETLSSISPSPSFHPPSAMYSNSAGNASRLGVTEHDRLATRPPSIRSSSRISFSRDVSPGASVASFGNPRHSAAGLSTMSASTASSTSAALQIEDSTAASMAVETNITAVGESVRSPTRGAEHELEVQKAAADRGDHNHSVFGKTVEALGLSSHPPRHHASQDSVSALKSIVGSGSGSVIDARRRSLQAAQAAAAKKAQHKAAGASVASESSKASASSGDRQASSRGADAQTDATPAGPSSSELPLFGPLDRSLRPLLRLSDPDRSSVVSIRLYRETGEGPCARLCLLVVHCEGRVCSWSLEDGELLWSTDLSETKWTAESLSDHKMASEELQGSAPLALYNSLTPMFAQLSMSMSKATSTGAKGSMRISGTEDKAAAALTEAEARLQDGAAVRLTGDVQMIVSYGRSLAAIPDQCAAALFLVDLVSGKVVGYEELDKFLSGCAPTARLLTSHRCIVEWVQQLEEGARAIARRIVTLPGGEDPPADPASASKEAEAQETASDSTKFDAALNHFDRLMLTEDEVIGLDRTGVSIWKRREGRLDSVLRIPLSDATQELVDYDATAGDLIIRTKRGLVRFSLDRPDAATTIDSAPLFEVAVAAQDVHYPGSKRIYGCYHDERGVLQLASSDLDSGQVEIVTPSTALGPRTTTAETNVAARSRVTAALPLSLERIVVALDSGSVRCLSLTELTQSEVLQPETRNSIGDNKTIITLRQVVSPRSSTKLVVGGTAQGDVAFWDAATLDLAATWSISTSPIEALIAFDDDDNTLRLHGCLACVAADSSVSVVLLDGLRFLYAIPGRDARLRSLAVRADELLLTYDDGKARVWDLRSQELRRSIAVDQAKALVLDGNGWWTAREVEPFSSRDSGTSGVLASLCCARGPTAAAMLADFRRSIEVAARSMLGVRKQGSVYGSVRRERLMAGSEGDAGPSAAEEEMTATVGMQSPPAKKALGILRPLLMLVLPAGLRDEWDAQIEILLGLAADRAGSKRAAATVTRLPPADRFSLGLGTLKSLAQPLAEDAKQLWSTSSLLSTQRALICVAMLGIVSHIRELSHAAEAMIEAVTHGVAAAVGAAAFRDFSLSTLTFFLLDSNLELQSAARSLFAASLGRMRPEAIEQLCDAWQPLLPVNQQPGMSPAASTALSLLGAVAVPRFKSLSPLLLKQISQSITILLADEANRLHQAIAIDLCSTGFSIWQHYLDAASVVRSLFALATDKEANPTAALAGIELWTLARAATLRIASENTPLFMTTLSMDILHAHSPAHCSATMKLVAFMVRKRPAVLYPSLPRLAEAVIKSLDPSHSHNRDYLLSSATLIISELVATYPSICFSEKSQRLAVGTMEGAVIVYDVKTATRLTVLEGHVGAVRAIEFSSDGRRVVSVAQRQVGVWKLSVSGWWSTKASVVRWVDVPSLPASDDVNIRISWIAERTVRIEVGETTMNLSVE